jgi:hypothetical protein
VAEIPTVWVRNKECGTLIKINGSDYRWKHHQKVDEHGNPNDPDPKTPAELAKWILCQIDGGMAAIVVLEDACELLKGIAPQKHILRKQPNPLDALQDLCSWCDAQQMPFPTAPVGAPMGHVDQKGVRDAHPDLSKREFGAVRKQLDRWAKKYPDRMEERDIGSRTLRAWPVDVAASAVRKVRDKRKPACP